MNIAILYPPISRAERYSSSIGNAGGSQAPLGVFSLAAYLRRHGHTPLVIDGEANHLTAADIAGQLDDFGPELVGISSTTVAFHRALELAAAVRERRADVPIVLGGPHVSSNAPHAMSFPAFDYGVVGEGEVTFVELAACLAAGRKPTDVAGLVFRDEGGLTTGAGWLGHCERSEHAPAVSHPDGSHPAPVVTTSPRPPMMNLDDLPPPAYDLIPDLAVYTPPPCNYKKLPAMNIITSRGCPNRCTFCDRSVFGSSPRFRSAEHIADEIELLSRDYGVREIAFVDDTFTLRPKRVVELFELLDGRGLRFPWTCMSRVNTVDEPLLKFMRDHGCWHISFGIESGSEAILRRIRKGIRLDDVHRAVAACKRLGIRTKGFFIVGHPGETLETIEQTIRLALDLPLDDIVATINTPIPGSIQHAEAHLYGQLDETDWSQFNYWRPVFVPHGLTKETLLAKHREFYRRFYLRPRVLWRYGCSFLSPSGSRRLKALCRSVPFLFRRAKNE